VITGDAELAARVAGDQLARGSLQEAERYLALASQRLDSVPADRRGRSRVVVAVVRMRLARQRGDLPAVAEEAERLLAPGVMTDLAEPRQGGDLRALALINLGIAEAWTARFDDADRHLENGIALAHEIGRPYLEVTGLAHWAQLGSWRSFPLGAQRSRQAIELAERHGWADEPITGFAHLALGVAMVTQGRLEEAEQALGRAERIVMAEVEPAAGMRLHYGRGMLEFVSGRHAARLPGGRTAGQLAPHTAHRTRSPRGCARTCCRHSCGQAKRGASSNSSRPWTSRSGSGQRHASPRHRCGSPRTTRRRRPPCSHPSSKARPRCRTPICGTSRRSCSRRSPATRSATRVTPGVPSSWLWTTPRQNSCCSPSCTTSSARTAVTRPSSGPAPWACSRLAKLVLNNWLADLTETTAENLSFARRLDLDPAEIVDLLQLTPLGAPYAVQKARSMLAGDFSPAFALKHALKDAELAAQAAQASGATLTLTSALLPR
jgi:hypothetical protein